MTDSAAPSSPDTPPSSDRSSGFSVLELLVVLVISSLAVGAALVYRGQQSVGLRVLALQLASQLATARERAIATDSPVPLLIDPSGTRYRVQSEKSGVQLPKAVRLSYRGVPGLNHGAANSRLEFFADGSSTGGTFQLSDGTGTLGLRVELLSGAVIVDGSAR